MANQQVAVILSGCGYLDGSEITEAVSLLIALEQKGIPYDCYAPDQVQFDVVNHLSTQAQAESRNALSEAARLARGRIQPLTALNPADYAGLALPGGFGVAKNLSNFAQAGLQAGLHPQLLPILHAAVKAQQPILAMCAAPILVAMAARDLGLKNTQLSVGAGGEALSQAIMAWGQSHIVCGVEHAYCDANHGFITVPAYMCADATPARVLQGAQAGVQMLHQLLKAIP